MDRRSGILVFVLSASMLHACGDPEEALRVELPVVVDASEISVVTNDLGYEVELTEARVMVENFVFAIAGEAHATSLWRKASDFLFPTAYAHPGHFQGGEVTGELRGRFLLNWLPGGDKELGMATLVVGVYKSANFTFARAGIDDGAATGDPLLGHTALFRGLATRGADSVEFLAVIDSPDGRELIGAPFELEVKETSREELGIRLVTKDPLEDDTLFDGLDFTALDVDGDGQLAIDPSSTEPAVVEAYNLLRRTFQTHDHFEVKPSLPTD